MSIALGNPPERSFGISGWFTFRAAPSLVSSCGVACGVATSVGAGFTSASPIPKKVVKPRHARKLMPLDIEAHAKRSLAEEYDAAQARGAYRIGTIPARLLQKCGQMAFDPDLRRFPRPTPA